MATKEKMSVEYEARIKDSQRGEKFDAMSRASKNALAAILSEDSERLKKLAGRAQLRGLGKIMGGINGELAPHLLSTAAALGWVEGVRILSSLDNQWDASEVNWKTLLPSALGESHDPRPSKFGSAPKNAPYRPLGFACISGSVECAREIIETQWGERRFLTEDDYWRDQSTLGLLVEHGGGLPLEAYIDAVRGISPPDAISAMAALESLLDGAEGAEAENRAEAEVAQTLSLLIKHGMSIEPKRMALDDKEYDRVEWCFSLWAKALRESRLGVAEVFLKGGITVDGPPGQHPLAVASGQKDPARQAQSAQMVKMLLDALPSLSMDNGVVLLALERAVDASNWPAATALAAAMSIGADNKERLIRMAAMRGGQEESFAKMALSHFPIEEQAAMSNTASEGAKSIEDLAWRRDQALGRMREAKAHLEAVEGMARRLGFGGQNPRERLALPLAGESQAKDKGAGRDDRSDKIKARASKARAEALSAAALGAIPKAVAGPRAPR